MVEPFAPMHGSRRAFARRLRAWIACLLLAGWMCAPSALAQIYKCTEADGRTTFSDRPCANPPGAAASGKGGVTQDVLRQPRPGPTAGADTISALCAQHAGSKPSDAVIQSLPDRQREAVVGTLRGIVAGLARDRDGQESLNRVTLHMDAARNAILCTPRQLAQSPGAPRTTTFVAHRIEPNGRTGILQPGTQKLVFNDANEPTTVAERCSSMITSCVRSKPPGSALDECFEQQPSCPAGRLDPTASCCPQACKDAYRRERTKGIDAVTATMKVLFGDDAGAASCIPGMPRKG